MIRVWRSKMSGAKRKKGYSTLYELQHGVQQPQQQVQLPRPKRQEQQQRHKTSRKSKSQSTDKTTAKPKKKEQRKKSWLFPSQKMNSIIILLVSLYVTTSNSTASSPSLPSSLTPPLPLSTSSSPSPPSPSQPAPLRHSVQIPTVHSQTLATHTTIVGLPNLSTTALALCSELQEIHHSFNALISSCSDISDAAKELGYSSRSTLYRLIKKGILDKYLWETNDGKKMYI